ncbi:MAG: hypothetical protein JWN25_2444 [Verrucomicrobiales bacterium]|nr:hypothetical protein [Verrucomicrobiales bacterium]
MVKNMFRLFVGVILFLANSAWAEWLQTARQGDVAYFLFDDDARIERFSFSKTQWLSKIHLPETYGAPTAFCVDSGGIYLAYGRSLKRYDLNGASETHLINGLSPISNIFTDGNLAIIDESDESSAHFASLNKLTGVGLDEFQTFAQVIQDCVAAVALNKIIGHLRIVGDRVSLTYNDDGTFGMELDVPEPITTESHVRMWLYPDQSKIIDQSGKVYTTGSLSNMNEIADSITSLDFNGLDAPIVLRGTNLVAYNKTLVATGSLALAVSPQTIYVNSTNVFAFTADVNSAEGVKVQTVPIASLTQPAPGQGIVPALLQYTPDSSFLDKNGIAYLLSILNQNLFRWDPVTQRYLAPIPLAQIPSLVTYSSNSHRVYTAYPSGLIRQIDLNAANPVETPFTWFPRAPTSLLAVGKYLFVVGDGDDFTAVQQTYSSTGLLVDSQRLGARPLSTTWSDAAQKIFLLNDDYVVEPLRSEAINGAGKASTVLPPGHIGASLVSQTVDDHLSSGIIRVSPDGTLVVLGSGVLYRAPSLDRLIGALANSVTDVAWVGGEMKTIRTVTNQAQFQDWVGTNYGQGISRIVPGIAYAAHTLNSTSFLGITISEGKPSFYVMDKKFNIIAPSVLDAPGSVIASVVSPTRVDVTWSDGNGEESYLIERKVGLTGAWTSIGTVQTGVSFFSDNSVVAGITYFYRIISKNGSRLSLSSVAASVGVVVPITVQSLSIASVSTDAITITWGDVANESFYLVERMSGNSGTWYEIAQVNANMTQFVDGALDSETHYSYRVMASNGLGNSAYSQVVSAVTLPLPPSIPTNFEGYAASSFSLQLYWSLANHEDSFLERRDAGGTWNLLFSGKNGDWGYLDDSVRPETSYEYRVRSSNSLGLSAYSGVLAITTPALSPPFTPREFSVSTVSGTALNVRWNNVQGEAGYYLEMLGDSPDSWSRVATFGSTVNSFVVSNLTDGVEYSFRLQSFNEAGNSDYSQVMVGTPYDVFRLVEDTFDSGLNPAAWQQVSGVVTNGGAGFRGNNALWFGGADLRQAVTIPVDVSHGGTIEFLLRAGNEAEDGDAFWNNSEYGEDVAVEYTLDGTNWYPVQVLTSSFPYLYTWTSFSIPVPRNAFSTHTVFRWTQRRHSGQSLDCWALDNVLVFGQKPAAPSQPSFIISSANSSTSISVHWLRSTGADSYILERNQSNTGWVPLATVIGAEPFYIDTLLIPGTTYSYRVKAHNAGSDSSYSMTSTTSTWSQRAQWNMDNYGDLNALTDLQMRTAGADGVIPLLRYAFNLNANDSLSVRFQSGSNKGTPAIYLSTDRHSLTAEFVRRKASGKPLIQYSVEFTSDLKTWTSSGVMTSVESIDDTWERVRFEEAASGTLRFGRVTVIPSF